MKRTVAALAVTSAMVAVMAWPASAKGEGPVGATITGPGIGGLGGPGVPGGPGPGGPGGPDEGSGGSGDTGGTAVGTIELGTKRPFEVFQYNALWRLVTFTGADGGCYSCLAYIDTTPPKDRTSLGPVYRVNYFVGKCCAHVTRQLLYPFAPGGPWAYTASGDPRVYFAGQRRIGWWHADGRMGVLFLRFLHHLGIPKHDTTPAVATKAVAGAAGSGGSAPWRLPVGIVAMVALLALGALAARPRSRARPA